VTGAVSLQSVLVLLASSVLAVALCRRLKLPALVGYLVTGLALGPHALGLVSNREETQHLAEFGVVFLMFSIGLEFSLGKLRSMRRVVFGLGGAQVGATLALAHAVFRYIDRNNERGESALPCPPDQIITNAPVLGRIQLKPASTPRDRPDGFRCLAGSGTKAIRNAMNGCRFGEYVLTTRPQKAGRSNGCYSEWRLKLLVKYASPQARRYLDIQELWNNADRIERSPVQVQRGFFSGPAVQMLPGEVRYPLPRHQT